MSRTIKGSKGSGYDYGARRAGNKHWNQCPSLHAKQITHGRERAQSKRIVREQSQANQ